uniref:Zinc metalloproteinase n=1 Tax=Strongyloides papillosus TaxID=174720 RepID=A0A0N5B6Y3_STREA
MTNFFVILAILILTILIEINYVFNRSISTTTESHENTINSNDQKVQIRTKKSAVKKGKFKWEFPIKYYISQKLNKEVIKMAIKVIEAETCVNFTESLKHIKNEAGINFSHRKSVCSSEVGRQEPDLPQPVNLAKSCADNIGSVLHELGHALGMRHEQARRDRDKYIKIIRKNIEQKLRYNFAREPLHNSENFSISYDLSSLMHYDSYDFAIDDNYPTIVTLDPNYNAQIGQQNGYTFNDVKLINYLYCNDTCPNGTLLNCQHYSYPDPKNCSQCKCPSGFAGHNCSILQKHSDYDKCGSHYYNATNKVQNLNKTGVMNCTFHIKAISGKIVNISVTELIASPQPNISNGLYCFTGMALEIKHRIDKSVTGLCLCNETELPVNITSEGDEVIILWSAKQENHTFSLTYKEISETSTTSPTTTTSTSSP